MSEPMVSHDCVAFYLLSEEVSRHVKVVQCGQGADEILAGYSWYQPLPEADGDGLQTYAQEFFDRDHDALVALRLRGGGRWAREGCSGSGGFGPIAWRGSEQMGVAAQMTKTNVAIAAWDWGSYFDPAARTKGLKLTFGHYRRPDPRTAPTASKATGLYMICTIEKHKAERAGYADALMLDWRGQVAEATGANIFFVQNGVLHTPLPDCFLNGITRRTVIGLAKQRGLKVIERAIMPEELSEFSECFITGTAAEVMPVAEIGQHKFVVGDITRNLMDDYSALVRPAKAVAAAG